MVSFDDIVEDLTDLVWGKTISQSVVEKWSQGLIFSEDEPTCIVQLNGGPCSVLTPVQAFLLRELLCCKECKLSWTKPKELALMDHLRRALQTILENVADGNEESFCLVLFRETPCDGCNSLPEIHHLMTLNRASSKDHLIGELTRKLNQFCGNFGVILLLYSVIMTKGIDAVRSELDDVSQPLIDSVHGYGSQSLLNLFLCGCAVANVWDDNKEVEGLVMKGVPKQASIGYLNLMENFRYCEVGWNLKNPEFPIWILASDTHMTVCFSEDRSLIERSGDRLTAARKAFHSVDEEGRGFINTNKLETLLSKLSIKADKNSVSNMKKVMDCENLGIITQDSFMRYFFNDEEDKLDGAKEFIIFHYNGIPSSNRDNKVRYRKGTAKLEEFGCSSVSDSSPIGTCLRTKWPTLRVIWEDNAVPSLN